MTDNERLSVILAGDHFARQGRDSVGLAARLWTDLTTLASGIPVMVTDASQTDGGIRETARYLSASSMQNGSMVVLVVGAFDSRGGGSAPAAYIDSVLMSCEIVRGRGSRPVVVLAPPCPSSAHNIKGFNKGSRRWLKRLAPYLGKALEDASVPFLHPDLSDDDWSDQLALRPDGVRSLSSQIARRLATL